MKINKNITIVFNCEFPFLPHGQECEVKLNNFFNLISYTYLPLLRMCKNLESEAIPFSFAIAFEGSLCEMLSSTTILKKYIAHLDKTIEFCDDELSRCHKCKKTLKLIQAHKNFLQENKKDLIEYDSNILKQFDIYAQKGCIEIMATTATSAFLPFYINMKEAIAAQIETGKLNYRQFFSGLTSGFWLPGKAGYISGLEKIIRSYGFDYTVVDTKAFLFSDKIPSYGIFSPAMTDSNLVVFAKDMSASDDVIGGKNPYINSAHYLNTNRDIGFELSENYLSKLFNTSHGRRCSGFTYYSQAEGNEIYDITKASEQAKTHAEDFVANRLNKLKQAEEIVSTNIPLSSVFIATSEFMGNRWFEGIKWLENVFKVCAKNPEIQCSLPRDIIKNCKQIETISPFFSSLLDDGYAGGFLNNENDMMYRHIINATERMIDLANRFEHDTGLKRRVLNMAAREIILAQSTIWPLMANTAYGKECAEKTFTEHITSFNRLYDSLGSGVVNTKLLSKREHLYPIFSEINYRSFSQKK
ncbi:MAG: hypothetical protein CR988_01200 [Treponema sp.]|nr:MAG: hypothetical protein CR988_01200 [Treponema sp.]